MNKKVLAIVGGVLLVVLVACGGLGYVGYTKLIKPAVAYATATKEMNEFNSAEYSYTQTTKMEMTFLGELEGLIPAETLDTVLNGEGKIDVEAERLYMKTSGEIDGESIGDFEYYLIGEDVYILTDGEVVKSSLQEALEQYGDSVESFEGFTDNQIWTNLKVDAAVEVVGETEIDGVEVYEYKVTLSEDDLKLFRDTISTDLSESLGTETTDVKVTFSDDVDYRVYVSIKDSTPVRELLSIGSITVEFTDLLEVVMNDYKIDITYSNVNEDLDIEAPSK